MRIKNSFDWENDKSYLKAPRGANLSEEFFQLLIELHAKRVDSYEYWDVIGPLREELIEIGDKCTVEFLIASTTEESKCTMVKSEVSLSSSESIIDAVRPVWPERAFAVRVHFNTRRGLISKPEAITSDWYDYFGLTYTSLLSDRGEVRLWGFECEKYKNDVLLELEEELAKENAKKRKADDDEQTLEALIAQTKDPKQRKLLEGMRAKVK